MNKQLDFETALHELEKIVNTLEKGDISLQSALNNFEQGIKLVGFCGAELEKAEKKIDFLTNDNKQ